MKVLMATMQLDIGGAETHIVELSKELKRRGIDVMVASNGGAYVQEIEEAGIKHFKVALNSKSPISLWQSYHSLKKIIIENKIDVVHAHARIPGFLCGLLHARYKFRFVTTAHWVFNTKFPFNLLTNWGDRSLAVSDDIKKYLIDNYNCDEEKIRVTINGIDTQKFSDSVDFSDIAKEFNFGTDKTRIIYVSRMDVDRSLVAHKLIEATPEIFKQVPDLEVVIVGGGNDYEQIQKEAENVNTMLGSRVVITTGARVDINKFVASGDVFVGVSRAALEAMACKKPSIIAGNEGYIGIFDKDKLQVSIDTNFCCRGCEDSTTDRLKKDLLYLLADGMEEKRRELGEYSLETVEKYYSVKTMADDNIKMYISIIKNSKINDVDICELEDIEKFLVHGNSKRDIDVVLSGYYGFNNSGDDSILEAIITDLRNNAPNISIVVLSKKPSETEKIYGVKAVNRFNLIKIAGVLRKTKLLISGGGSLIQDVTSSKSLYYYLAIIRLAKVCGAKIMLYANGIGPITKEKNIKIINKTLEKVSAVTLREKASSDELKRLNVKLEAEVTADPVFAMPEENVENIQKALAEEGSKSDQAFFVVAIRSYKKAEKNLEEKIIKFVEYIYKTYKITPIIMPMQFTYDMEISKRIANKLSVPYVLISKKYSAGIIMGIVKEAKFVFGMRLHALIYAIKAAVPVIALDYDPKVNAIMKEAGQEFLLDAKDFDVKNACRFADKILSQRDNICRELIEVAAEYKRLANKNTEIAIKCIKE